MKTKTSDVIEIDEGGGKKLEGCYDPNYKRKCCVCGQKPCVRIRLLNNSVYYDGDMCGPCTWGEAETIDPNNW